MVAQIKGLQDVRRNQETGEVVIVTDDRHVALKLQDGKFVLRDETAPDLGVPGAEPIPDGRIAA